MELNYTQQVFDIDGDGSMGTPMGWPEFRRKSSYAFGSNAKMTIHVLSLFDKEIRPLGPPGIASGLITVDLKPDVLSSERITALDDHNLQWVFVPTPQGTAICGC